MLCIKESCLTEVDKIYDVYDNYHESKWYSISYNEKIIGMTDRVEEFFKEIKTI